MKKYQSEALKVIHQDAEGLHRLGIISDKEMREYDQDCLIQEPEHDQCPTEPSDRRSAVVTKFA